MDCEGDERRMIQFSNESRKFKALFFLVLLGSAGCAEVGPDYQRPEVDVAPTWRTKGDSRISEQEATDSQWWKSLNDPTLDHLVDMAYRQNLTLQVAGLRIMEARARLGVATGRQFPQIQAAFGSAMVVGLSKNMPNSVGIDTNYADYQLGFDAVWEMDFWGKYRRGVEAETANALAMVADYYYSIVSVAAEVARTYVTIRTFEVLIAQANQNEKIQRDSLQIADSRLRHGATSELDVAQATVLLESTRATIPQLQAGLEQARNALSTLLGQPPGFVENLLQGPQEIPRVSTTVAVGMPADILRRRPDVRAAELAAAAQCARIGVAEAELYPSFSLVGTIGLQASSGAAGVSSTGANSPFFSFGPQFRWTFLDYGRTRNSIRVEDARFQQLLVGYREAVLRAAEEVENYLAGFLYAQDATVSVEQAVKSSERAVQIAMTQYREGAVDFQRVLDAQRSLLEQQNSLAQTRSNAITNLVSLYKALGGGWESYQNQSYVPAATKDEMKKRTNWGDMLSEPVENESKKDSAAGPMTP